ncbi:uncharacterized protein [Ptychodera flava]|uniref:uncharacterized protein isoform X2 n=2 Tax=Ptychodera flava TaxID=63121 RepID=UPI00396A9AE9
MITFTFPPQFSTGIQDQGDGPYLLTSQQPGDDLLIKEELEDTFGQAQEGLPPLLSGGEEEGDFGTLENEETPDDYTLLFPGFEGETDKGDGETGEVGEMGELENVDEDLLTEWLGDGDTDEKTEDLLTDWLGEGNMDEKTEGVEELDEFQDTELKEEDDVDGGWLTSPSVEGMFTAGEMRLTSAFIPTGAPDQGLLGEDTDDFGLGLGLEGAPVQDQQSPAQNDIPGGLDLGFGLGLEGSPAQQQPGQNDSTSGLDLGLGLGLGGPSVQEVQSPAQNDVSAGVPSEFKDVMIPLQGDKVPTERPLMPYGHIPEGPKLPDLPVGMPDLPVGMPDLPVGMPDLPVGMPDLTGGMPDLPVGMPDLTGGMPGLPVGMPQPQAIPYVTPPHTTPLPERFIMENGKLLNVEDTHPRYLFPMFRLGVGGPNYQYNSLKTAIGFAMKHNRAIVLSHFFPHHMNSISERMLFNETFDIEKLSEIIPVASVEQFKKDCDNNLGVTVHGPPKLKGKSTPADYQKVYETVRLRLGLIYGVKFPGMSFVPKTATESLTKISETDKNRCLGIYWPHNVATLPAPVFEESKLKTIDSHLTRAKHIQAIATTFVNALFKDCPFLGIHWSMNDDLKKIWCETVMPKERRPLCLASPLPSRNISSILISVMEKHQLDCAYAAFSPDTILAHMRDLSINMKGIKTFSNLYELDTPYASLLKADEDLLSLVEQEICTRAKLFIGVSNSWWTYHIARERTALGLDTFYIHDMVSPSGDASAINANGQIPKPPGGPQVQKPAPAQPQNKGGSPPGGQKPGGSQGKPPAGGQKPPSGGGQQNQGQWKPGGGGQWKPPANQGGQWKPPSGGGTQWKPPSGGQWNQNGQKGPQQWKPPANQGGWKPPSGGKPPSQWKPPSGGQAPGQWKPPGGGQVPGQWKPPSGGQGGQWRPGGQQWPAQNQWKPPAQNQGRPMGAYF